jgi:thymidylate synthase
MKQYIELIKVIREFGSLKQDRTGTGTISSFGHMLRFENVDTEFPLMTIKKVSWKNVITELRWFLKGETNIRPLVQAGNNIWVGDAYRKYCSIVINPEAQLNREAFIEKLKKDRIFSELWGEMGKSYGHQWRNFNGVDQIKNLIDGIKANPNSRRHLVSAWNPKDLPEMLLPPCHTGFQIYCNTDKKEMSLMWSQRSCDVPLGLPYNIASYAALLHMIAHLTGYTPKTLIASLGDAHIYQNQLEYCEEILKRSSEITPKLPILRVAPGVTTLKDFFEEGSLILEDYAPLSAIKAPLSN